MEARREWKAVESGGGGYGTAQKDGCKVGDGGCESLRWGSGRRMRSHAAPDWSVSDAMVLVNEMSAVEDDCSKQVSSYQKWKMVAENCRAFGVFRASNQCSRQWAALLLHYTNISRWQSLNSDSYWSLSVDSRKEFGLPQDFDCDLFKAIHQLVKQAREEEKGEEQHSDADIPVSHPPAAAADHDFDPQIHHHAPPLPPPYFRGSKKPKQQQQVRPRPGISMQKLCQNAEQINVIVKGWSAEAHGVSQTDLIRRQGDELISYLGDMANNLGQLCDLVLGC